MRNTIIRSLDVIVWIIAIFIAGGGVIAGLIAIANGQMEGIAFIIGGPLYAIIFAGFIFVAIGIYDNTKRTAEAIEKLAAR